MHAAALNDIYNLASVSSTDFKECLWMEYSTISREWIITPELIGAMESLST